MSERFMPPIYATTDADGVRTWTLDIGVDERQVVTQLLGELRALLSSDGDRADTSPLLQRLFPPVYTDDEEKEAEYQRLMREELVTSRLHQIDAVTEMIGLDPDRDVDESAESGSEASTETQLDEAQVIALMQSVNAVRVVLGTMLDVGEDDEDTLDPLDDDAEEEIEFAFERRLYDYLSWLLDWTVRSLSS